jgi:hypothetical protein
LISVERGRDRGVGFEEEDERTKRRREKEARKKKRIDKER